MVLLAANLINAAHVTRPDISTRNRSRESEPPGVAKTMGTWDSGGKPERDSKPGGKAALDHNGPVLLAAVTGISEIGRAHV